MSKYLLAKHAYLCVSGGQVVILDLHQNEYSAFDLIDASPLSTLVPGWPAYSPQAAARPIAENDEALADLLKNQILTADRSLGKNATPVSFIPAAREILKPRSVFDDYTKPRYPVQIRHRRAFFAATRKAGELLKNSRPEEAVNHIAGQQTPAAPQGHTFDWEALQVLVASFRWLRPWGYASKDRCLFDSLCLVIYLMSFGVRPSWIFGVKADPFEAHCWVQADSAVLSDWASHVREFTPIMSV